MRDIASLANQATDDIFDATSGSFEWAVIEKEVAEALTAERHRCAALAEFYGDERLVKAIRAGAFVDGPDEWWSA